LALYSWQSDSDDAFNRNFIEDCIKRAIKKLRSDECYDPQKEAIFDKDTRGMTGSPLIGSSIFKKIEQSNVFIADLTPIKTVNGKWFSNPNVLIEFGFALSKIGDDKIIYTMNLHSVDGEQNTHLPFDLRERRFPVAYDFGESNQSERNTERDKLTNIFFENIKGIYLSRPPIELNKTIEISNQDINLSTILIDNFDGNLFEELTLKVDFDYLTPNAKLGIRFNFDNSHNYELDIGTYRHSSFIKVGSNNSRSSPYRAEISIAPVSGHERILNWKYSTGFMPPQGKPTNGHGAWRNTADEIKQIEIFSLTKGATASGYVILKGKPIT